ncbi:SEN1 N terminal-domain-containing protein [Rhodocollybia butyracea]|uniref:SEN1 N terminal-domain-containing protein n=1 Tax=Rhodocollybia butyracea TaxID=206335 RepID=A0A9P5Q9A4_9AGAR|nr:SEN1 N terminal-domain-containing protein [Rhodocollybia butyracea]
MAGSAQSAADLAVQELLKRLHDEPRNSENLREDELDAIYAQLQRSSGKSSFHWFCSHAEPLTVESATFLLRLFAYNSPKVEVWKDWLNSCLGTCSACVIGFEKSKIGCRNTYFGAFPDHVKDAFWDSFNAWELEHILAKISTPSGWRGLSAIPIPIVYRMLCNFHTFRDPRIQEYLEQNPPTLAFSDWPTDPPPPALLVLMMHRNSALRSWSVQQVSSCTTVPISQNDASSLPYDKTLEIILQPFSSTPESPAQPNSISLVTDPVALWSSFHSVLRLLHPKHITYLSSKGVDVRHVVIGHLHDHGPEFKTIVQCFSLILKRLGKSLWNGEGPEYPQVAFDAFKDNQVLNTLLSEKELSAERNPWFFNWIPEFLLTIRDQQVYPEVVAKITDFMCEELQHERFGNARPIVMACASRLLKGQNRDGNNSAVTNVLDIHAEVLVSVAFSRSHQKAEWKVAREATRDLIHTSLMQDLKNIRNAISRASVVLSLAVRKPEKSAPHLHDNGSETMAPLAIREQIWKKIYAHLQPSDTEGLACILSVLASAAHFDSILKASFAPALSFSGMSSLIDAVNRSLQTVITGFTELTSSYDMTMAAPHVSRFAGVAKDLIKLMLSPMADLHAGAMGIVTQADADGSSDGRRDCFRWLFETFPDESFSGSFEMLTVFNDYAPKIPEACSLSKILVRCFTDIIGVLCSSSHGLLHKSEYLRSSDPKGPASRIPQLWTLMCRTITVIFKRTPSWSQYYKNEVMTEWMRDALIFARDILGERPVFESAARSISSSSVTSKVNKRMLDDLQEILAELARWLRLTDEELLHQSCTLIHSLLEFFRESENPLPETVLQKLTKQVVDVRKRDISSTSCILDPAKLAPLEAILASFDEKDDEVEIVETRPISKPVTKPEIKPKVGLKRTAEGSVKATASSKTKSSHFSVTDQEKLDAVSSMPTFRKPLAPSVVKPVPQAPSTVTRRSTDDDSSSDSEESAEEESQRTALLDLGKLQKSPKIRKPVERRQVKMLDLPHLKRNAQEARLAKRDEARNKALRFKPDISSLHKTLLSWDYHHDGNSPPKTSLQLRHVPHIFSDFRHYRSVFEPLLLMECWAQLLQSKDETPEKYECKITAKMYNGQWSDLEVMFTGDLRREWFLTENDVVLLHNAEGKNTLAKAMSFRRPGKDPAEARLRCYFPPDTRDPGLNIQSSWQISKVFSLSTLHREYAALIAVEYYDFADRILRPYLAPPLNVDPKEIRQVMEKYKVNEPQARAIASALKTDGFVLVQGPPGTGKTSTICALISASLKTQTLGPSKNVEKPKILLCAPSNAAIDEIVHRLKDRFPSLKVVRTGAAQSISLSVKDVSLDSLIETKLGSSGQNESKDTANEMISVRQEFQTARSLRQEKIQELHKLRENGAPFDSLEAEVKQLTIKTTSLRQRLDGLRDKHTSESRTMDTARRRARDEVLREADVICSTLSGTGHENLEQYDFEMVIIDEAAQAIELSSLIPLKYRCNRCVMVGDPQQLPPTVISMEASKFNYNQSLFVRLQTQRPDAVHLLSIQYRMHPDISQLPSKIFYDNRLQDGPDMDTKTFQPWHAHSKFGTYRFFNVKGLEESSGRSTMNKTEVQVAVALFNRLRKDFSSVDFSSRVGVVSMYSAQIKELKRVFEQRFGREILNEVDFRTVDGFQGQEKDIIILSCVRGGPGVVSIGHVKGSLVNYEL